MGLTSNKVRAHLEAYGISLTELITLARRASNSPYPERCALVLSMRYNGFTFAAIAKHISTSRNNVKLLEARVLSAVERERLKDERA